MGKEEKSFELVVVDTNIFIDYLRNYSPSIKYFHSISLEARKKILFSAITETELISGKSCNENLVRTGIINMLNCFKKIEVDNPIALKAGDLCRMHGISLPDAIIASTALLNNAELFSNNIKDFQIIPNLKVSSPY